MKKHFFVFGMISLMAVLNVVKAQPALGVKAGVLFSNIQVKGVMDALIPEQAFYTGYESGVYYDLPINANWSFLPGIF